MDCIVPYTLQQLVLDNLLSLTENKLCVDCQLQKPDWVSLNYGVFICFKCSGVHRSLGAHNTRVKSAKLDSWTLRQLCVMFQLNNQKANEHWEANLPTEFSRCTVLLNETEFAKFIRSKYIKRTFVRLETEAPVDLVINVLECQEEEDPDFFAQKKEAELIRLVKPKTIVSQSCIQVAKAESCKKFNRQSTYDVTSSSTSLSTLKAGAEKKIPCFVSPEASLTRSKTDISSSQATTVSMSLPLFEGLKLKSQSSIQSLKSPKNFQTFQLSKFAFLPPLNDHSSRQSSSKDNDELSPSNLRTSTDLSLELIDEEDQQPTSLENCLDREAGCLNDPLNTAIHESIVLSNSPREMEEIEKHQSISLTLKEAQKDCVHLKRPSEAFEVPPMMIISERVRVKSDNRAKFSSLLSCFLIHTLLGYLYIWGAITPAATPIMQFSSIQGIDYFQGGINNILIFSGASIGFFSYIKMKSIFGMKCLSIVCFVCLSSLILLSSSPILLTFVAGLFIGIVYQIPVACASSYFCSQNALKFFSYLMNGLGAFLFINLYHMMPPQLDFDEQYKDKMLAPQFLQIIASCFLVLGVLGSLLLPSKALNKDTTVWEQKVDNSLPSLERPLIQATINSERSERIKNCHSKYIFLVAIFYFTFCGFFFCSYKSFGLLHGYSDYALSLVGSFGILVMVFGKIAGVIVWQKIGFSIGIKIAIITQGVLGVLCYLFRQNDDAVLTCLIAAMFLQGIGFSFLLEEGSQLSEENKQAKMKGCVYLGYAISNLLGLTILAISIVWGVQDLLYLLLSVPLVIAFGVVKYKIDSC